MKLTPLFLLMLLGFIWGTGYSIARFAMTNGVPPLGYSFWQVLGPALVIGLLSSCSKDKLKITVPHLQYYLICGLTGILIPNTNMYFASPHLPAGILAVIVNTVPLFAYPLALSKGLERFNLIRFSSLLLAMIGLMLILLPKTSLPTPGMTPWVISSLLTPLSFAFCSVYISRYRPPNASSISLSAGALWVSSLILLPFVFFTHHFYALHWPLTRPDEVIILEIILSSVGYILFFQLIKIAGPVYYSFVDTIVSLTGLFWGYVIFHEKLNQWNSYAIFFILLALFLVTKHQRFQTQIKQEQPLC